MLTSIIFGISKVLSMFIFVVFSQSLLRICKQISKVIKLEVLSVPKKTDARENCMTIM